MFFVPSTLIALVISFISILYVHLTRHFNYWDKKGVKVNGRSYPLVGSVYELLLFNKSLGEYFQNIYLKHNKEPYVGLYFLDKPVLLIRDTKILKQILVKNFQQFNERHVSTSEKWDPVSSNALLFMKNPNWKISRHKVSHMFSASKLKIAFNSIKEVGNDLNQYITDYIVSEDHTDAKELCLKYTLETMGVWTAGVKFKCLRQEDSVIMKISRTFTDANFFVILKQVLIYIIPEFMEYFRLRFFHASMYDDMETVFSNIFRKRRHENICKGDLIDLLIELEDEGVDKSGLKFDKNWLLGQASGFYVGGFETTSSTISFALYELCLNMEIQNRLRSEIHEHYKTVDDCTYENIRNLKYLHMVVSETLRKYPVFHFLDRKCTEEFRIPETGLIVEKATPVLIPLFGLHYDPEFYPNPHLFDPERFHDDNEVNLESCAYLPFGLGPRNCIGGKFGLLSVKLGLVQILYNFEVISTPETPVSVKFDPKMATAQAQHGLPMKFRKFVKDERIL